MVLDSRHPLNSASQDQAPRRQEERRRRVGLFGQRTDRERLALVRAILDSALDAIILIDHRGQILEFGRSAEKIFAYPAEKAVGRRIDELFIPARLQEKHRWGLARAVTRGEAPFVGRRLELPARRADGTEFPAEVTVTRLEARDKPRFVGFIRDITQRRQAERKALEQKQKLRALGSQLSLAEERERRRISIGLHDRVGHPLAIARLRLGQLENYQLPYEASRAIEDANDLLREALEETRSLTFELSSPVLWELGLKAALRSLGQKIVQPHDVRFEFSSDPGFQPLEEAALVSLYRAVEELLVNTVKHARATTSRVAMHRVGNDLEILVEDDGVGFDPTAQAQQLGTTDCLGLFGIRERLEHLGGRMKIDSTPGAGTRAVLSVPLGEEPVESRNP